MNAPSWGSPVEGAFASAILAWNLETRAPFASALAGAGAFRAAPGGVLQGRFGYGGASSGLVYNAQQDASDALGVVVPLRSINTANGGVIGGPPALGGPIASWSWQTFDRAARSWRMRAGLVVTLMSAGNFWLRFDSGAVYGQTVYASTIDGSAFSGDPGRTFPAIETPFTVCSDARPGSLAIVSSTAHFNT